MDTNFKADSDLIPKPGKNVSEFCLLAPLVMLFGSFCLILFGISEALKVIL